MRMETQDYPRRLGVGEQEATFFCSVVPEALAAFGSPAVDVMLPPSSGGPVTPASRGPEEDLGLSAAC